MANKYLKIKLHLVFAAKRHESYLPDSVLERLYAFIAGVINNRGNFAIKLGGTANHVHILFDYNAVEPLPDLVKAIKTTSTKFINENNLSPYQFHWQTGYACFSVSPYDTDKVVQYIENQLEHHQTHTLRDEVRSMFLRANIPYDDKFIFEE